jgi:hypothetical protein
MSKIRSNVDTAIPVANDIAKLFNGKRRSKACMGWISNPYDNRQVIEVNLKGQGYKRLIAALRNDPEWKETRKNSAKFESKLGVRISVGAVYGFYSKKVRIDWNTVFITGYKNAKPTTIPYYD